MVRPLESSWIRARHAVAEATILSAEIHEYLKPPPLEPVVVTDGATGQFVAVLRPLGPPPSTISIRMSTVLHHLRSALDGAVWELSSPPTRHKFGFPIVDDLIWWTGGRNPGIQRIAGITNEVARAIIEDSQPFKQSSLGSPKLHVLSLLRELSDLDKHRFLATACVATSVPFIEILAEFGEVLLSRPAGSSGHLVGGSELFRFTAPPGTRTVIRMRGELSVQLAFESEIRGQIPAIGCRDLMTVIGEIGNEVLSLLRALRASAV